MIVHPSRTEWDQITGSVHDRVEALVAAAGAQLPPTGDKTVRSAIAKFKASAVRPTQDLVSALIILDLHGAHDVLLEGSRILRDVPFTGDHTLYEPVRQLACAAFRTASRQGSPSAADFELYLSFGEHGGETGARVIEAPHRNRMAREPRRLAADIEWNGSKPTATAIANTAAGVAERCWLWAFGGSPEWPLPAIDREIQASTELLTEMGVIAPVT